MISTDQAAAMFNAGYMSDYYMKLAVEPYNGARNGSQWASLDRLVQGRLVVHDFDLIAEWRVRCPGRATLRRLSEIAYAGSRNGTYDLTATGEALRAAILDECEAHADAAADLDRQTLQLYWELIAAGQHRDTARAVAVSALAGSRA